MRWPWERAKPAEVARLERLGLGLIVSKHEWPPRCSFCQGHEVYAIATSFKRIAPSGQVFVYRTDPFAWLCPPCKAVGKSSDLSVDTVHVDDADTMLAILAEQSRASRERRPAP